MLRPFPARLIRGASKTYAGYMNDLKAAKREHTQFIRRIKFLEDCLCQETRLSLIVRRCVPPHYYIRTDAVCLFMMRVSNIFNSKVFPSNILAGFDTSIQIWIDGPACRACRVKPSVLPGSAGCHPTSSGPRWQRVLMPKAALFSPPFRISIGDSIIYRTHIVQGAGPLSRAST